MRIIKTHHGGKWQPLAWAAYQVLSITPVRARRSSTVLFLTTMFRIEARAMFWYHACIGPVACLRTERVLSVSLNSGTDFFFFFFFFFCESVSLTLYVHSRTRRRNRGGNHHGNSDYWAHSLCTQLATPGRFNNLNILTTLYAPCQALGMRQRR